MLKAEKKFIEWIDRHMTLIALVFVILAAMWIRAAGRNFVGIDYHFSLYDIPGNCNSYIYRTLVSLIMPRWSEYVIVMLKFVAYLGDFGVALLSLLLMRDERGALSGLQVFLVSTACLLAPVSLIYSVTGMEIDSVCMCFMLLGMLLYQSGRILPALPVMTLAAFLYPAYWPVVIIFGIFFWVQQVRLGNFGRSAAASLIVMFGLLILSVFLENSGMAGGYYWGKLFVTDPNSGAGYASFSLWLLGMCRIYGYCFAMLPLILSFRRRRLRIPALVLQLLVLMLVGWYQTRHLAV